MYTEKYIIVKFTKEGTHCYPAAATNHKLATQEWDDVSFLANDHRHIFHFKVYIEVFHNDRDLEFIQEKRYMERLYSKDTLEANYKSCEMLADDLYGMLLKRYHNQNRRIRIEVTEDNENGCEITYPRT